MFVLKDQDQGIIKLSQQEYLPILIESFLIDRKSQGLSPETIDFYTNNPGGVHACFRPLRTLLYWIEAEEIMPAGWKNPIRKVKAPKLPQR